MYKAIVEVYCVDECCRPEGGRETGSIEECLCFDVKFVVHDLSGTVLRGAVGAGRFDKCLDEVAEVCTFWPVHSLDPFGQVQCRH